MIKNFSIISISYIAAICIGILWTLIPALEPILTNQNRLGLSQLEYSMLNPLSIIPTIFSLIMCFFLVRKIGIKITQTIGLICLAIYASLFFFMESVYIEPKAQICILQAGQVILGLGLGLSLSTLNIIVYNNNHDLSPSFVTGLFACLTLGGCLCPQLVSVILKYEKTLSILGYFSFLILLTAFANTLFIKNKSVSINFHWSKFSEIFYSRKKVLIIFFITSTFYGVIENIFNFWDGNILESEFKLSSIKIGESLTLFWGSVFLGQLLVSIFSKKLNLRKVYIALPFVIFITLIFLSLSKSPILSILLSISGGLGCSIFFPLTILFLEILLEKILILSTVTALFGYFLGLGISSLLLSFKSPLISHTTNYIIFSLPFSFILIIFSFLIIKNLKSIEI